MEEKRINKSNILWHEHIKMEGQIQEDRAMKEKHFYIILPNGKKKISVGENNDYKTKNNHLPAMIIEPCISY